MFPVLIAEHVYTPFYMVYVIVIVTSGTLEHSRALKIIVFVVWKANLTSKMPNLGHFKLFEAYFDPYSGC